MESKIAGNTAFKDGKYQEAIKHFSNAIDAPDIQDVHVLFSNRSGAKAAIGDWQGALSDADECIQRHQGFAKGYSRKGFALYQMGKMDEAATSYRQGIAIDPENALLKEGLTCVENYQKSLNNIANAITNNPKLQQYQKEDPTYATRLAKASEQLQSNPQFIASLLNKSADEKIRTGLFAMMGIPDISSTDFNTIAKENDRPENTDSYQQQTSPVTPPSPPVVTPEEELKQKGNKLYKERKFQQALEAYDEALIITPHNLALYSNKAAVYMEIKEYEKAEEICIMGLEERDSSADCIATGKIYQRLSNINEKQHNYPGAIHYMEKALVEENTRQRRVALRELQKVLDEEAKQSYINPELSIEHKNKGNELFKAGKFPEAKKEYDEAIKRDPNNSVLWGNRAAAYTKLLEFPTALKDVDKALELDPKNVKCWSRKGNIHCLSKEYNKALSSYDRGLAVDSESPECRDGKFRCIQLIQQQQTSGQPDEETLKHAMQDPEIQSILADPQFQLILKNITEAPHTAESYMKDPQVSTGIQKLIAAGVLRCA